MSEPIAVQGMTVGPSDPTVTAVIVVTPADSPVLCENKIAHKDGDQVTVTAISTPGAPAPDPGPYTVGFVATSNKCFTKNIKLLRESDQSETITASPTTSGGTTVTISFSIVVNAAGQTSVLAE